MEHLVFSDTEYFSVAILIKQSAFSKQSIEEYYVKPSGLTEVIALSLNGSKAVKDIKADLNNVLKACKHLGITTILCADSAYFKVLTKSSKADPHLGYILPCKIPEYEDINVILSINWQALFHNPDYQTKIDLSIDTLKNHLNGTHVDLGTGIIHFSEYPETDTDIISWLYRLLTMEMLTCDIETTGLRFDSEILTIAFAWSKHEGIAFKFNKELLAKFFINYKGTLIFHNASFDIKLLIYNLYMTGYQDYEGLLHGLEVMYRSVEDTKIITYLATNSTSGNELGLKANSYEFAGNYALEDMSNVADKDIGEVLKYNLVDCLATWYVYEKNYPILLQDNQLDIYRDIMLPSLRTITHMETIGLPMSMDQILKTSKELKSIQKLWTNRLLNNPIVTSFEWREQRERFIAKNSELKKKVVSLDSMYQRMNPNSGNQLQRLLYNHMGFDVIDTTDKGAPSTSGDTLEKLYVQLLNKHEINEEDLYD